MEHFIQTAEKFTDLIVNTQNYIWSHPETGYKEWNTSAYLDTVTSSGERIAYTDGTATAQL